MSIDIAAEIKFSPTNINGVYSVRLQDDDQTIIGRVLRDGTGWIPQYPDGYFESHTTFTTRYMAARPVLEAYELANGLRDSEGRRVGHDPETKGYWVVLSPIGTKQSPRWTDKADAIAHLASLQVSAEAESADACTETGCGKPLADHYGGIGCLPGRPGGRVIFRGPYPQTETEKRGHTGHKLSAQPTIAEGGWDARIMRCEDCGDQWTEVRGMPAEGVLIDPDPHLDSALVDQRRCIEAGEHLRSSRHTSAECTGIIDDRPTAEEQLATEDEEDLFTVVAETVVEVTEPTAWVPMKVWKLARLNVVTPEPRTLRSVVVIAQTEDGAREMAAEAAGEEGRKVWSDADQTNCWSFGAAEESYVMPGIICRDFLEA